MLVQGEAVHINRWIGDNNPAQLVAAVCIWTVAMGTLGMMAYNTHLTCLEAIKNGSAFPDAVSLQNRSCYWMLESELGQAITIVAGMFFYAKGIEHLGSMIPEPNVPIPLLDF